MEIFSQFVVVGHLGLSQMVRVFSIYPESRKQIFYLILQKRGSDCHPDRLILQMDEGEGPCKPLS